MGKIAVIALLCFSLGLASGAAVELNLESNLRSDSTIISPKVEESGSNSGRIVGGYEARKGDFPWMVSIQWGGQHRCGGFIVNSEWIATTYQSCAIKAEGEDTFTIVAGEHDLGIDEGTEQIRNVSLVVPHPEADGGTHGNNIALMKLSSPLTFGLHVSGAQLPLNANFSSAVNLVYTGWGETLYSCTSTLYSPTLRRTTVQSVGNLLCEIEFCPTGGCVFGEDVLCTSSYLTNSRPSNLDEGSPLHSGNTVVGVISSWVCFMYYTQTYTSIPYFVDWIREVTGTPAP